MHPAKPQWPSTRLLPLAFEASPIADIAACVLHPQAETQPCSATQQHGKFIQAISALLAATGTALWKHETRGQL
jgi:hypothetical protein